MCKLLLCDCSVVELKLAATCGCFSTAPLILVQQVLASLIPSHICKPFTFVISSKIREYFHQKFRFKLLRQQLLRENIVENRPALSCFRCDANLSAIVRRFAWHGISSFQGSS